LLTADLVHVRRRGEDLSVIPLGTAERARALELGAAYLELANAHVGLERGRLMEAFRQLPVSARERKLASGLAKLVLDRCDFEEPTAVDPAALRVEVFTRAAEQRRALQPRAELDRAGIFAEVGARHGLTAEALEASLYADLPEAHLLRGVALPGPRTLVDGYETAQVQAVLLRAVKVRARVQGATPAEFRRLFHKLKFLQLLHQIQPLVAGEARGYEIHIDGPFSLFESVTKYGLQLALAYPEIAACGRWALEADVRWGKDRRPLRFVARGDARETEMVHGDPPLPDEVSRLLASLGALAPVWQARLSERVIDLPGVGLCVPDLEITKVSTGQTAYVEVMGFWSRDAVWRRIELAQQGAPAPLVFCVSKHLRVSEAALPEDVPAALYVYAKVISPRPLMERVERVLGGFNGKPEHGK
jgi:predicted nuclease of restriction endonuclease-like RecB superfamily